MNFASIPEALEDIKKGKMIILLDNPKRENEADFYIPAEKATPEIITIMIRKGGGLVCAAITTQQAHKLELPLMVDILENKEKTGVNFTVSVNAKEGITTGISAYDRAKTIKVLANPASKSSDIVMPGHVFGLIAKQEGLMDREGHTEAAVDLARLAGFESAGVLCEIISNSGRMANPSEISKLADELQIKVVFINDLIIYLKKNPLPILEEGCCVARAANAILPTKYGLFEIIIYHSISDDKEHAVLKMGEIKNPALIRVHSQCLTGDTFSSLRCDCGDQLSKSMKIIAKNGSGIIIYLNQEGRGIGLTNKIRAYQLQDKGMDTVEANEALGFPSDLRDFKVAADIIKDMGISEINLLTNNPDKKSQLTQFGIKIVKRIPLEIKPNKVNLKYLKTKKQKLNHQLKFV